jgi:hypothetical protein
MKAIRSAWDRFWFTPSSAWPLGLCRALFFGMLAVWMVPHDFSAWGGYSRVFWMPISLFRVTGVRPLPVDTLAWIQLAWKASLILSAIGFLTRPAMFVAAAGGTYLMGLPHNFGQTQHFDTLVVLALWALALSRAGDAVSVDAWIDRAPAPAASSAPSALIGSEYTWPIRFVWVAMALIFGAAGISKVRHSGLSWIFSDSFRLLLLRQQYHISDGDPLTTWGVWVAMHSWLTHALAATALSVELFFPLVLFSRRARAILVPAGLFFLVGIRLLMGPTFEQFMMCYVFWVPWQRVADIVRGYAHLDSARAGHRVHGDGVLPAAATVHREPARH